MSNKVKDNISEALFNFYLEADDNTIKDVLKDEIIDLEEYNRKKKQIAFLARAKVYKKQNEYLLELVNKFQDAILLNIERPIAILKQIIQENPSFALYRNLEKITKEDIIEIIKDKNLIELLEQLDDNDKIH